MDQLNDFFGYFNLVIGVISLLIGFKIYKPFNKDKEEEIYRKYGNLFRVVGIVLTIGGLIKILFI